MSSKVENALCILLKYHKSEFFHCVVIPMSFHDIVGTGQIYMFSRALYDACQTVLFVSAHTQLQHHDVLPLPLCFAVISSEPISVACAQLC